MSQEQCEYLASMPDYYDYISRAQKLCANVEILLATERMSNKAESKSIQQTLSVIENVFNTPKNNFK